MNLCKEWDVNTPLSRRIVRFQKSNKLNNLTQKLTIDCLKCLEKETSIYKLIQDDGSAIFFAYNL